MRRMTVPKSQNLTETTPTVALTRGKVIKGKVGHGSKSCGNNTHCCSDKGIALATEGRYLFLDLKRMNRAAVASVGQGRFSS